MRWINLSLLVLYPLAWFAPLLHAGLLPVFGLSEISVISGLQSLWASDVFLALLVTVFALFAPYLKTLGLALVQFKLLDRRTLPALNLLGKFAMADIFPCGAVYHLVQGDWRGEDRNRLGALSVHSLYSDVDTFGRA